MLVLLLRCLTLLPPPAAQLSVLLLHLAHLALEAGVHFPLRLEVTMVTTKPLHTLLPPAGNHEAPLWFQAIRTFNSILESLSRQQRRLIQNDQNQNL